MTGVRASVIIVNYNSGRMLAACLRSLEAALGDDDEVIVVDCASADGSADDLPPVARLRLWRSPLNLGFASGSNLGAHLARGRYLAFLNPDTTVEPGWLDTLIEALEADPSVGLV
ncbi:MAG: glycosyltransferase, partial [Chloroflexota bacterium]